MSSYFDELNRKVAQAAEDHESDEDFLVELMVIEGDLYHDVTRFTGDREFPDDLRERIMGMFAVKGVFQPGYTPIPERAADYALATRSSLLVEDMHDFFHDVARRRVLTRFGLLSDHPKFDGDRRDREDVEHAYKLFRGAVAVFLTILGVFAGSVAPAHAEDAEKLFGRGLHHVGILGGYGTSFQRYGGARDIDHVRYATTAIDWGIGLTDPIFKNSPFEGNLELLVEGLAMFETQPNTGIGGGAVFLLRWNFLAGGPVVPFVTAGGGFMGLDFDLASQRDGFVFSLQGGVGTHVFLTDRLALTGEWCYQHTSNARTKLPNGGLDMSVLSLGATWFFGTP